MFSCCRTNEKSNSKAIKKKDKSNKNKNDESNNEQINETTTKSDRKSSLVIPTITIENGKTTNDDDDNNAGCDVETNLPMTTSNGANTNDDYIGDGNAAAVDDDEKSNLTKTKIIADITTERTESIADLNVEINSNDGAGNDANKEQQQKQKSNVQIKASHSNVTNTTNATIRTKQCGGGGREEDVEEHGELPLSSSETTAAATTTKQHNNDVNDRNFVRHPHPHHQEAHNHSDLPSKSCLSRHNSTHTSIKKKVNISTHAEIIEPDPLPPPPYDHALMAEDEDDVFSDSLPPPKRESMCAPYIEPDDELLPETVAFAHGLPEWFNDERIHDIGCIEPPVTPVGRDELELKRQRLYADLLRAAHAAVEHNVRFTPFGPETITSHHQIVDRTAIAGDCDPDLKPSVAENLEHLVNRLERLVERLERSISARELEIANRTFDTVLEKKRESFDLESAQLPPLPTDIADADAQAIESVQSQTLNRRIERIESSLNKINDRHSNSLSAATNSELEKQQQLQQINKEDSLENIPATVLEDFPQTQLVVNVDEEESILLLPPTTSPPPPPPPPLTPPAVTMSVLGYQDIIYGPLNKYLQQSLKIGGEVANQAQMVKKAFETQLQYISMTTEIAQPSQDKQMELLKPTSTLISAIQDYREKNRASPFFNHLSAISESIPALGWVCVAPTPGPHVKEMNDAGQFYTNRVLKEWKERDVTHVEWARAWVQTLTELQAYIKEYYTTGLVWGKGAPNAYGGPPPPPMGACPPPPPPPVFDLASMSLDDGGADERSALFAQINQGEGITRNLKKVTADMQTHKNPTLRTGPAPFKTPTQFGSVGTAPAGPAAAKPPATKPPVFMRDGKKWIIEHQKNNTGLLVENAEMNNVVYMFKCEGSTLTVKGKVNNIVMDSCKKCSLLFDSVVASIEYVNCQSVQMQVLGSVPTIIIDKTDGCQMYLSKDSLGVEIVSSKSSEMNVMLPEPSGDYTELPVPEQYKTTISGKTLKTICVDSLG